MNLVNLVIPRNLVILANLVNLMILVHLMILVNSCKASLVNEASHKLRNHFWGSQQTPPLYVIFIYAV